MQLIRIGSRCRYSQEMTNRIPEDLVSTGLTKGGLPSKKMLLIGLVTVFLISGCTADSAAVDPLVAELYAKRVCSSAESQLRTASDLDQVVIKQCEAQTDESGAIGLVLGLNDYLEWGVIETRSVEDIVFTIPLALVTYAFAKSGIEPEVFDRVLVALNDPDQTVYDIKPEDLREILVIQDEAEAKQALKDLRTKIGITSLK